MKFRLAIFSAFVMSLLTACSPSPSSVIKDFYIDVSDGKIDEALGLFDLEQATSQGFSRDKLRSALMSKSDEIHNEKCGGLAEVKVLNEEVRGDIATQKVRLTCKTRAWKDVDGKLMKGKDGWRVVVFLR